MDLDEAGIPEPYQQSGEGGLTQTSLPVPAPATPSSHPIRALELGGAAPRAARGALGCQDGREAGAPAAARRPLVRG